MRLMLLLFCFIAFNAASAEPRLHRNLAYMKHADPRQKLDLYLPSKVRKPPLLIFVHGGFWSEGDENYGIGKELAETLVSEGVAVALVRYRLATTHRHPAQIEDVAAAFAYLVHNSAGRYDTKRVFVAGHSAGGHLVSLLALDRQYLAKHRLAPNAIAGVIGLSGVYSLDTKGVAPGHKAAVQATFGSDAAVLDAASPANHVQTNAPPFLLLNADKDLPRLQLQARRFAEALIDAQVETDYLVLAKLDHLSVARPTTTGNPLRQLILWRIQITPLSEGLESFRAARREWMRPTLSTASFWERHGDLIEARPVDKRFLQALFFIYRDARNELRDWPLKNYYRIDLLKLVDALPGQAGEYISLRNVRDEVLVWHRSQIEAHKPVIVVGLDEERNLFKLQRFYKMRREYSWRDTGSPPMMVLPVGAFVYFENEAPPEFRPQHWHYGLTLEGIARSVADPLSAARSHSPELFAILTDRNGCLFCHAMKDTGSRSHHLTALGAKPHGGFALPLESYPAEVFERFLYRHEEAAAAIGATPNPVDGLARDELFRAVRETSAAM